MFFGWSKVISQLLTDHAIEELNGINVALTRLLAECEQELDRLKNLMAIEASLIDKAEADLWHVNEQLFHIENLAMVGQRSDETALDIESHLVALTALSDYTYLNLHYSPIETVRSKLGAVITIAERMNLSIKDRMAAVKQEYCRDHSSLLAP